MFDLRDAYRSVGITEPNDALLTKNKCRTKFQSKDCDQELHNNSLIRE